MIFYYLFSLVTRNNQSDGSHVAVMGLFMNSTRIILVLLVSSNVRRKALSTIGHNDVQSCTKVTVEVPAWVFYRFESFRGRSARRPLHSMPRSWQPFEATWTSWISELWISEPMMQRGHTLPYTSVCCMLLGTSVPISRRCPAIYGKMSQVLDTSCLENAAHRRNICTGRCCFGT